MRWPLFLCALAALLVPVVPAQAWQTQCNAAISATMIDSVNSGSAYPGMKFRWKTTEAGNFLGTVVPKGTIGYGYVRAVTGASNRNRNGSLILEMRELVYRNRLIEVMVDPQSSAVWAPAMTMTDRATNYIPIAGLIRTAVNEVRDGKNITIGPGFAFKVVALGDPRKTSPCRKVGK